MAAYATYGAAKALGYGVAPVPAFAMGVMTACVGGIIRDVLAGEPSILMRPELYVTAAALAAGLFVGLILAGLGVWPAAAVAIAAGFALRGARDRSRLVIARLPRLSSPDAGRLTAFDFRAGCLRHGAGAASSPCSKWASPSIPRSEIASFAEGFADPQSRRTVTVDDPARVASVSKLVVAVGVMKLIEAGQARPRPRRLRLSRLALAQPAFPGPAVSLRLLLSAHQFGARA